jgi:hypothetical protein
VSPVLASSADGRLIVFASDGKGEVYLRAQTSPGIW